VGKNKREDETPEVKSVTEQKLKRAREWARAALADAARRAEETREAREEFRRRMGWTE
jgi:hypothetical protein